MLKGRRAGIGLAVALAVGLAAAAPSEAQTQRPRQQQRTQPQQQEPLPPLPPTESYIEPQAQPPVQAAPPPAAMAAPEPAPPPARVEPSTTSQPAAAARAQEQEQRWVTDTGTLIFGGLLVAIGVLLFIAFMMQALYLWLALRAIRRSTDQSERNARIAQRAFVYIGALDWSLAGANVRISPNWENSGATPTRSLRISTNWKVSHQELPADFVYSYAHPPERLFLGPRARAEVGTVLVPMRDIQAALEERVSLYFWGRATYDDVFDGTEPHFAEFCYRIDVSGTPSNLSLVFALHGAHNRTDEDSQRPIALDRR